MSIVIIICWWILGTTGTALILYLTYRFLYWRAKKDVDKFLASEQEKLERDKLFLQRRQQQIEIDNAQIKQDYATKTAELNSQIQKAKEEHINALKIKEQVHYELRREFKINQQLRDNLNAARQRAKRFAKKVKTEV